MNHILPILAIILATSKTNAQNDEIFDPDQLQVQSEADSNPWISGDVTGLEDRRRSATHGKIYYESGPGVFAPGYGQISSGTFPSPPQAGFLQQFPPYYNFGPAVGYQQPVFTYPDRFGFFYRNGKGEQRGLKDDYRSF